MVPPAAAAPTAEPLIDVPSALPRAVVPPPVATPAPVPEGARRVRPRFRYASPLTLAALLATAVLAVRYLAWRWQHTLNPEAPVLSALYLAAELVGFVEVALFFATTWRRTAYPELPRLPGRSVDVFVATYNEPPELLRDTLVCAVSMRYPHRTFVLDDGNRPEVAALARDIGCEYIGRADRRGAKAGNLNNALLHTDGEFVVTLDADHVPAPDLIDRMIGALADADVGVVQANQDFYNLDSFQHDTDWARHRAWQQQELFFSVIQPGKDAFNAAYYCGSPAMLRRSALALVGGFAEETITEDMHTSLRMHKRGLRSVYLNESVARGLAPQTFDSYVSQWQRWGEGAMQVLRIERPVFGPGLTFGQRLCYLASTVFYLASVQKLLFLVIPAICLLTGIFPLRTDAASYASYFLPYMAVNLLATSQLQGGWQGFWRTEQFNLIKLFAQLRAVRGLWTRKRAVFNVTPKTRATAPTWHALLPHFAVTGILVVGIPVGVWHAWTEVGAAGRWAYGVTVVFCLYFLAQLVPVLGRALRRREARLTYRFPQQLDAPVRWSATVDGTRRDGVAYARNLNRFGLSLTLHEALPRGAEIELTLTLADAVVRAVGTVRWTESLEHGGGRRAMNGIRFDRIRTEDQDEIAKYLFWEVGPRHGAMLRMTHHEQQLARSAA